MKTLGFRIHKPKLYKSGFPAFQTEIMKIAIKAQQKAQKNGSAPFPLIVFSEVALKYTFNIAEDEVVRSIEHIQKCLPDDLWMGIAFSVLQLNELEIPRNTGYLFDSQNLHISPKRWCTNFDSTVLSQTYGHHHFQYEENWDDDGFDLQKYGVRFPFLSAPNGKEVEIRVCADVDAKPIKPEPDKISLVPAHGLNPAYARKLSMRRALVIINDHEPYETKANELPSNVIY